MTAPNSNAKKTFQAPKGMRDFYPADMAVRRYIEGVWRQVSINHGFEEIEGPMFESLDLYTHKSGPGIVSELFQVFSGKDEAEIEQIRQGKDAPFALRPEFTPTLARMVAARAAQLPKPIKWFTIPNHFRAERPQRGRLREFMQWNVDFIGVDDDRVFEAIADVHTMGVLVGALERFGLTPVDVRLKFGHRLAIRERLGLHGRTPDQIEDDLVFLDTRQKISSDSFRTQATERGWSEELIRLFDPDHQSTVPLHLDPEKIDGLSDSEKEFMRQKQNARGDLQYEVRSHGIAEWCEFDSMIIRGLAYYTGLVFEAHEASGGERAIAGGGRYDKLIESFGGPSMTACGFGMGDVVLGLLLHEKGLLPEDVYMRELRPHAFVISSGDDAAEQELRKLVAELRRAGYHVRHTYRSTRNVGKLLGEAGKNHARTAIILDEKLNEGLINIKDLNTGEQSEYPRGGVEAALCEILAQQDQQEDRAAGS
ncbi:MAG: histidine--tRNA ligase [Phycisphaerales bacterium]|nr:MAG: histidine--tRNA ligase [Phycisphaerales bacterium]